MRTNPFKSEEEKFFWDMVNVIPQCVPAFDNCSVLSAMYEPMTLRLSATQYTPDFFVYLQTPSGKLIMVTEVKGSKKQKGYRETRTKLLDAAALYPMFIFYEVLVDAKVKRFESFELITPPPFPYIWVGS